MGTRTTLLVDGLVFPEGPRWRDNKLWFSDMMAGCVRSVDLDGNLETVVETSGDWVSGLGWLPDGRLLVVSMNDRCLLRLDPDGLIEAADLKSLTKFICNDMVVDANGNAYIGEVGFDVHGGAPFEPASLVCVSPTGEARVVDSDLACPNGAVISQDGGTLIVAESLADRLTAYDIEDDGSLSNKRTWAQREGMFPDGMCLDAEGAIWVASPMKGEVLRLREGGEVLDRFETSPMPVACMLGGPDRRTLFVCEGLHPDEATKQMSGGQIETLEVDVPGAGLP